MRKYHIILTLIILLAGQTAWSQVTLNLALNSRPQPWLADWSKPINGQMIITFMPGAAGNDPLIKLRTTLMDEGENVIGISNVNAARLYTLRVGANQFSIAEALQLQNLSLPGNTQNSLRKTGRIPAGQYHLKVEVLNSTGEIVRATQTRPFFIAFYQLPVLMQPANGTTLDAHVAQNIIIFRWTGLAPRPLDLPEYRVQVFEILSGQTPMQAFRGNRPLLDEPAMKGTNQYIWRTNLPMLDTTANHKFIWTVQTLDAGRQPVPTIDMSVQGRSEPAIFSIINQTGTEHKRR